MTDRETAEIILRDLEIAVQIGTYGPGDVVPEAHVLDMTLTVPRALVWVSADDMAQVFDYDPLIAQIDRIARSQHFATQEYVLRLISQAIADHPEILGADLSLSKRPVLGASGRLGVRLVLGAGDLAELRRASVDSNA